MKTRTTTLIIIITASAAAASWYVYHTVTRTTTAAGPPAAAPSQTVAVVKGETIVIVNPDVQRASHIDVEPVTTAASQPEITAYATVIDLQPLFDLRNRWAAARADRESAQAQVDSSRSEYERNRVLFENDRNVSQKNL